MAILKLKPGTYTFAELFSVKTSESTYTPETIRTEATLRRFKVTDIGHLNVPAEYVRNVAQLLRITPAEVAGVSDAETAVSYMWSKETGEALRNARGDRDLEVIAGMLGVELGTIHRWERGTSKPQVTNVLKLRDVLGMNLHQLLKLGIWPPDASAGATGLGRVLAETRLRMGYSYRTMSRHVGVPEPTYRGWETGRAHPKTQEALENLADALGVDVALVEATLPVAIKTDTYGLPEWSKKLVKIREDRNVSIEDLVRLSGARPGTLRMLEKGIKTSKHNFVYVAAAARAYGVDPMWLLVESSGHVPKTFEDKMRYWRVLTGMTVHEVAPYVGFSRNIVVLWEKGVSRPPLSAAALIAESYGLNEDVVIDEIQKAGPLMVSPFSSALLEARNASGDSAKTVCERLGVSTSGLRQMESSRWLPAEPRLKQIASAYGTSYEVLYEAWAKCVTTQGITLAKRHAN
jgi:transcriptional regulator with XRE-family HTH domain